MTDKEIVKAWIVVIENKRMPTEYLINVTIDRINSLTAEVLRQQAEINVKKRLLDKAEAEIEQWKEEANKYQNYWCDSCKEIERLQKENTILSQNADTAFQDGLNEAQDLYAKQVKAEIKSEAYREFAKKIHEELRMYGVKDKFNKAVFLNVVDNAKKELVGEGGQLVASVPTSKKEDCK